MIANNDERKLKLKETLVFMVNTILIEMRAVQEEVQFLSPLQTIFLTHEKMHKYLP